ncbi:MAG: DUF6410 domain-containing protein [Anaerolineales bacterium]
MAKRRTHNGTGKWSYGGCEVMALPSLIFRRRYFVYCPWNVVDLADKVIEDNRAKSSATAAD